ncbi:uncharacterized protein EI90DRAFT_3242749 [Cantharellus anzutake]|uniref:uncharacterized protein n=1 Tax=Cantharellus anzutake TaxID=1750568 RepID=UPI001905B425|nr:uncharacterized protein EI90DRAFT_3242749 [Cantharellus anzutake]KAF8339881.1 hypothetical protein EI90DRAFT_3242749 [Cantharellus anzutake]
MGQNYALEMMAPMQAPPYPIFAPGMWGYNPHMQREPVRPPIAASNDSILGNLLKEASQWVHLLEGELSQSHDEANNLRNENKELRENVHGLEIENIDRMGKEANTYEGSHPLKIPHMSRVGMPPVPSQHSQHRAPVVPMSVSNVEAHNRAVRPPVPTRVRVPLAGLMDSHYGHHAAPIPPLGPQGPSSSFGAMMVPPPPQPSKAPNLVPEGYSWFTEANCSPAAGTWRNVPIPGTFFQGDFRFGVTISGQNWPVSDSRNHRQKWWNDWVHLFLNSIEGFKFMNVSATELDGCFGDCPRNFENTNKAGKKYLPCCLWKHYCSEAAQIMKATSTTAYNLSRLQVIEPTLPHNPIPHTEGMLVDNGVVEEAPRPRHFPAAQWMQAPSAENAVAGLSRGPQASRSVPASKGKAKKD